MLVVVLEFTLEEFFFPLFKSEEHISKKLSLGDCVFREPTHGKTVDTSCRSFSVLRAAVVLFGKYFFYEDWNLYALCACVLCVCVCVQKSQLCSLPPPPPPEL